MPTTHASTEPIDIGLIADHTLPFVCETTDRVMQLPGKTVIVDRGAPTKTGPMMLITVFGVMLGAMAVYLSTGPAFYRLPKRITPEMIATAAAFIIIIALAWRFFWKATKLTRYLVLDDETDRVVYVDATRKENAGLTILRSLRSKATLAVGPATVHQQGLPWAKWRGHAAAVVTPDFAFGLCASKSAEEVERSLSSFPEWISELDRVDRPIRAKGHLRFGIV